jgi:hypothetical protein
MALPTAQAQPWIMCGVCPSAKAGDGRKNRVRRRAEERASENA